MKKRIGLLTEHDSGWIMLRPSFVLELTYRIRRIDHGFSETSFQAWECFSDEGSNVVARIPTNQLHFEYGVPDAGSFDPGCLSPIGDTESDGRDPGSNSR